VKKYYTQNLKPFPNLLLVSKKSGVLRTCRQSSTFSGTICYDVPIRGNSFASCSSQVKVEKKDER
jgi:hypothetical protein